MYEIGDKIVYPKYGAGIIESIVEKKIGNAKVKYYTLIMPGNSVKVLLPVDKCDELSVRRVMTSDEAKKILEYFRDVPLPDDSGWNRRHRENIEKIRSGDIFEIVTVLKKLMYIDRFKGLSTSERKMFISVREIIVSELVLSGIADRENIYNIMDDVVSKEL